MEFLGPQISLKVLRDSITTACVKVLGATWDERLGQLKAFKEQYGDCSVPSEWGDNPVLGRWVGTQRRLYKSGKLADERVRRLDEIGFEWDPVVAGWDENFTELSVYQKCFGNCDVPGEYNENPVLGRWVGTQRRLYKSGKLAGGRVRRLDELGFKWDPFAVGWDTNLVELNAYQTRFGSCNVPLRWDANPILGQWVSAQRIRYRSGKLDKERVRRLDELGFTWDILDVEWDTNFAELSVYQTRFGSCNVQLRWDENPVLGQWVSTQRRLYKSGKLSVERIRRLERIGFKWDIFDARWDVIFTELTVYQERFGSCDVPFGYQENPTLGQWVSLQRRLYKSAKLDGERVRRLNEIGFKWEMIDAAWDDRFIELKAYEKRFGNCDVPNRYKENLGLGHWVSDQRARYKSGKLDGERVRRLNEIGFKWDTLDIEWDTSFAEYKAYPKRFGRCDTPAEYKENPDLGRWVQRQRMAYKDGKLALDRIQRLDEIGFKWVAFDAVWDANFAEYKENPVHGQWVSTQRKLYKSGKLLKERIQRLNEIGLEWDPINAKWDANLTSLKAYQKRFGNCDVPAEYKENPVLGRWVSMQRKLYKSGKLAKERIRRLEEIGFKWVLKNPLAFNATIRNSAHQAAGVRSAVVSRWQRNSLPFPDCSRAGQ